MKNEIFYLLRCYKMEFLKDLIKNFKEYNPESFPEVILS